MGSESLFKSTNGVDPFYDSGWDTIVPLNPRGDFRGSSIAPQNEFANSHYSNFSSQMGSVDMMPKIPSFGSGSYSEMVPSFRLPKCVPITGTSRHPTLAAVERALRNAADAQEHCESSKDGVVGVGVSMRKRKASLGASLKNVEVEHRKDPSEEASQFPNEEYDKKQKFEKNVGANLGNEQAIKQAKDNSIITAEPSKENFIHVRAKKGQATNSHSLAERVRRERISERMRLLQELVPGCNKITGKAVMLDEIINYVQSLQQQVEFLSMKLATVNPELEADIDRILSKDILQFRSNNSAALGIGYGLSRSHPSPGVPGTNPPYHHIPQSLWNNDLQSTLQMAPGSNLGPNGLSKMEL